MHQWSGSGGAAGSPSAAGHRQAVVRLSVVAPYDIIERQVGFVENSKWPNLGAFDTFM